jgi:Domain of unknown function (DUF4091)
MRPGLLGLVLGALVVALALRAAPARTATPSVEVPGAAASVDVAAGRGELEDATVVVHGARGTLAARVVPGSAPLVQQGLSVLRLETTQVDGRAVADPLPPLSRRATVAGEDVTLVLRFRVPGSTPAGTYAARLAFAVDGHSIATLPVQLRVFDVELPARDDPTAFRTLFLLKPQDYVDSVVRRTRSDAATASTGITDRLYALLSDYRISPGNWEYGTPYPAGYQDHGTYWDGLAATRMAAEGAFPFTTMRLPIGTQHTPLSRTGQSPRRPQTWAAYLTGQVLPFWQAHGWLNRALVWGWDEPGPRYDRRYVALQACAAHAAGVRYLTTAAPERTIAARRVSIPWGQGTRAFTVKAHGDDNEFLWDGRGCDDVDIWAVLSRRFYGSFATPVEQKSHIDVEHELHGALDTARARGASIWSFTYEATTHDLGSPGYAATEPATDGRVFGLWNALEGTDGTLYADGMTSYDDGVDPYRSLAQHGQHVLLYPALASGDEPVSSLRLESIRDGIEDADLARMLIARKGRAAYLAILQRETIFSIRHGRLLLACQSGCDLASSTKYAWPRYRHDAGTGAALERVHEALLAALASP